MKKNCIAMLLAGGQGSRLYALTQSMAKPSVPFGGKYRIIDFPLSNCANSGIDTVGDLINRTEEDMIKVRNLGRKSLDEVIQKVHSLGLELKRVEE